MKPFAMKHMLCGLSLGAIQPLAWAAQELQGPSLPQPQVLNPAAVPRPPGTSPLPTAPSPAQEDANAPRVQLRQIQLEGCQVVACDALLAALGPLPQEALSLNDIEGLARQLNAVYKRRGFPFVQVIIPPQRIQHGLLTMRVIEGALGQTSVVSNEALAGGAQAFLDAGLPLGLPLNESQLERTMLLIDDQPSYKLQPVLKPGQNMGESDLVVNIERKGKVSGDVGVDNAGNRSTGQHRLKVSASVNSPFMFGDRFLFNAMGTNESMWLGAVDYDRPLGAQGWRGQVGWSRTGYQLAGAFAALGANGYAMTTTLKASYPVLRSQLSNLLVSGAVQHKSLRDRYASVGLSRAKSSDLLTLAAQFDRRDTVLGGGVVYGQLSLVQGHLRLDEAARAVDEQTARTAGAFGKLNLDVARIQKVAGALSTYLRVSAQWAEGNLDSSEKYGLGGTLGVRAYPLGEGSGDQGWLTQAEVRLSQGNWTPFVFADLGRMKLNAQPWDDSSASHRSIGGAGVGLRWAHLGWSIEATAAGRLYGRAPQSETPDQPVRVFVSISRRWE